MALLTCRDLCIGYEGREILHGLNFSAEQGDYLCILGENGSGKSTLMKTILGLVPSLSGEIVFGDGLQKGEIGYLPQQTDVQRDFPASVREIVLSGCLAKYGFHPFYRKEEKKAAQKAMEELGITDLAKKCYRDLSGGQQQRVLLARALCAAGRVLLLDEPVTGLDPKAQNDLYELIAKLNKSGITIIMVSHDIHAAVKYASHVLHIGSKRQLFYGTKEEYVNSKLGQSFIMSEEAEENE